MKKIIYLTIVLAATYNSYAQNFEWLKTPDINLRLNTGATGYPTTSDANGNVYFVGLKENPLPRTEQLGTLFYIKYNSAGEELFNNTITGDAGAYSIAVDSQGNVIMILGFYNGITVDNVTISGHVEEVTDMRFVLAKFDINGNLMWHQRLFTAESEFNNVSDARAIAFDDQDNIYVGYDNYSNSYITKYSPEGDGQFTISQMGAARITSVSVDNEGNIYAAGGCANPVTTFNGTTVQMVNNYNIFAVKYSASGEFQWIKDLPDITCPEPYIIARTPNEVYFSSYLFGDYDFDTLPSEGPLVFGEDFFLAKMNATGAYQWVREVPGAGAASQGKRNFLTLDAQGNIYFAGQTGGTIQWNDAITTTSQAWSSRNALLLKYSPQGNLLNAITAGGDGYNRADAVTVTAAGDIYMSGIANNTINFGSITHEADMYYNYPFLARISQATMGNQTPNAVSAVIVYPNPAANAINFAGLRHTIQGCIYNTLGQKAEDFTAGNNTPVNISLLAKGTYFIKADGMQTVRFIKE